MNAHVIRAIFRRNFISYFSSPTGYVFICVFVWLSSMAAFWPNEFFNSNLANLDQLNRYLPYILLIFVPAITMSIWAEERRQGTDELLLTIPAGDFDVVTGKYLAAVAIYTVSLAFSFVSNLYVLSIVGLPDFGLLVSTYVGYWVVGVAMVAIGMVASFLTGNLTVGFVLGVLFNAPLVFAGSADVIFQNPDMVAAINGWSIASQFRDFSRGVVSLASLAYFFGIAALMMYLCMVLIGRRHWRGGSDGQNVALHYLLRFVALVIVVASIDAFLWHHNRFRADISSEQLASLSPATRKLLNKIEPKNPIKIYAYVSKDMPENYVQAKLNLLSTLDELKAAAGNKIEVHTYLIDPLSEEATNAEQQFNIRPERVDARLRGARTPEDIFLGVAVTCGLDKVVLPFLGKGLAAEYELMRSIATVSQQKRKKVGVLTTDAKLYGGFDMSNMQSFSQTPNQAIIDELQKQYDLVQVDPNNPITERYDVLLAVQPSSLAPGAMENFIQAVKSGQPTAIFEDPFPALAPEVPGTMSPKQPPGGGNPLMQRQPPQPKGDIGKLWRTLGVDFNGGNVVWQNYNPYPKFRDSSAPKEFVFVEDKAMHEPFNDADPISSKTQQLLFPFPGSLSGVSTSPLKFTPLVTATFKETGVVPQDRIIERTIFGSRLNPALAYEEKLTGERYVLAARITGKLKTDNLPMSDKSADDDAMDDEDDHDHADHDHAGHDHADHDHADHDHDHAPMPNDAVHAGLKKPSQASGQPVGNGEIDVVIVSDIDCLFSVFFQIRQRGADELDEIQWRLENVPFVLNVLDSLAGDESLIEIRKHHPVHRTLSRVEERIEPKNAAADEERQKFNKDFESAKAKAQADFKKKIDDLRKNKDTQSDEFIQQIQIAQRDGEQRLNQKIKVLEQKRDRDVEQKRRELAKEVHAIQDEYKLQGVLLPPILPLAVAFFVYFNRRAREREGVSKSRLRS